jgi:hypothetical protein
MVRSQRTAHPDAVSHGEMQHVFPRIGPKANGTLPPGRRASGRWAGVCPKAGPADDFFPPISKNETFTRPNS